jgi:hypothetical protein
MFRLILIFAPVALMHHVKGSPFTNPTGKLPAKDAQYFKVLDHSLNVLFKTPFKSDVWHNFGVQVDWDARTLAVLYSSGFQPLKVVTKALPNTGVSAGTRGEFHIGVLKVLLALSVEKCWLIFLIKKRVAAACQLYRYTRQPGRCCTSWHSRRNH